MTERLQAKSKKNTPEKLEQKLIDLCKDKQVFTYMDDINKNKDTLYNRGSDLSVVLNTFLNTFREEVITEYNKIYDYDKNKQLNKDKDLTSVIAAVNNMHKNDKETLRDNVRNKYFILYQAKDLIEKVDIAIEKKRQGGYHGVLMRF